MYADIIQETDDPYDLFAQWYAQAEAAEQSYPNAMSLATVGKNGQPSVRIVLLKDYNNDGFVFYTNILSKKGEQISKNNRASICFYWKSTQRQIRIEGSVAPVSPQEADTYFATRPRGSQIGAWASLQSQELDLRNTLEERIKALEDQYDEQDIPRPEHWSGYRLKPQLIEFWQEGPYRLHDRVLYTLDNKEKWAKKRLYP